MEGVSFVVPVHNGAALRSRDARGDPVPRPTAVRWKSSSSTIAADDGSSALLRGSPSIWPLRIVAGEGRGAAAAINAGVRAARYPIICQVDQDVVLQARMDARCCRGARRSRRSPRRRATTRAIPTRPSALAPWASISSSDTRRSTAATPITCAPAIPCTEPRRFAASGCSTRRSGYGYDNDMSYRLREAGYRLAFCRGGAQRAPMARRVRRLPRSAVRVRLRPHRSGGETSEARHGRLRVAGGDDGAPAVDGRSGWPALTRGAGGRGRRSVAAPPGRRDSARAAWSSGWPPAFARRTVSAIAGACLSAPASRARLRLGRGDRRVAGPLRRWPALPALSQHARAGEDQTRNVRLGFPKGRGSARGPTASSA